jgi:uncharacterized protein
MHYDIDKQIEKIDEAAKAGKTSFDIHGGEPLMTPKADMERLLAAISKYSRPIIQTNGFLIDDEWIALFKKYKAMIGVSLDGEGDLNMARGFFSPDGVRVNPASDEYTNKVMENLEKMKNAGLGVSVIVVLNRYNALPEPRQKLKQWLLKLKAMGVSGGRLNLGFVDDPVMKPILELSHTEAADAWEDLATFVLSDPALFWNPFREFVDNLMGFGIGSCHYAGCDPDKTDGEVVIAPDGDVQNCSRFGAEDGKRIPRPDGVQGSGSNKREEHLKTIPMSEGGCGGCRYWMVCYGGCPAQGWNRQTNKKDVWSKDRFCEAIQGTYGVIEDKMKGMMPNIRTVPDVMMNVADDERIHRDKRNRLRNQWSYRAIGFMSPEFTRTPSSYSNSARANKWDEPKVKEE